MVYVFTRFFVSAYLDYMLIESVRSVNGGPGADSLIGLYQGKL